MAKPPGGFAAGDVVEVICQDDGFKGSLYEARVVQSMPKLNLYRIEYESLMDEADPPKRLRETLAPAILRPLPPPLATEKLEIGEKVDAFYNDGWWNGEISKVVSGGEGGRSYAVRFPDGDGGGMEELVFGVGEIRVHMEWIDGKWISPRVTVENLLEIEFRKGDTVEVSIDDEGFSGAWYTATIIGSNGKNFLVEYKNLRTDDEAELLTETADSLHIRPIPPCTPVVNKYKLLEEVDAFYNDGWWVGVISEVITGPRYMVYFKSSNEEIEFGHIDLRLHHEWIDGKWCRASEVLDL